MFMITKALWDGCLQHFGCTEAIDYFVALLGSIATIPLDIVLSPFELIAWIIYKVRER